MPTLPILSSNEQSKALKDVKLWAGSASPTALLDRRGYKAWRTMITRVFRIYHIAAALTLQAQGTLPATDPTFVPRARQDCGTPSTRTKRRGTSKADADILAQQDLIIDGGAPAVGGVG